MRKDVGDVQRTVHNLHREGERLPEDMGPDGQEHAHRRGEVAGADDAGLRPGAPRPARGGAVRGDAGLRQVQGWNVLQVRGRSAVSSFGDY